MTLEKNFFLEKIICPSLFAWVVFNFISNSSYTSGIINGEFPVEVVFFALTHLFLYAYLVFFLASSPLPQKFRLTWKIYLALICLIFIVLNPPEMDQPSPLLFYALGTTTVVMIFSYYSLGRNLSIIPAYKEFSENGIYKLVRHPIYSCAIILSALIAAFCPNFKNLIILLATASCHLRATEEEKILIENSLEYKSYMKRVPYMYFHPIFLIPFFILLIVKFIF